MPDIVHIIQQELGSSAVLSGTEVTQRALSYWDSSPMKAKAIIRPASTLEVSKVLKICHAHKQSVVTHGGRTGCVDGSRSGDNDIVLSLERMNSIIEIDSVSSTATVEAGAILENIQKSVEESGLFLPLDLGARGSCTIGGNLATNAGGVNVIRYGMARSMVLGLEAVLPDGTIISSMNKMLKNNSGYDLKQLFIGTEGTLGVITRAIVKLHPQSLTKNTALAAVKDFSSVAALLNHLKKTTGANLSAFEVMWGDYYRAVTKPGWHKAPMEREHPYYVLFECDGSDVSRDADHFLEVVEHAFEENLIDNAVIPKSESERQSLWNIRDDFEAILNPKPVYLYDVSLPISSMEDYVLGVETKLKELLPDAVIYTLGHVGDGNLHFFIRPETTVDNARELSDQAVYEPLKGYNGSISAEHGIGFDKKKWLTHSRSTDELNLMKLLKSTIDPLKILNAGVIID